MLNIFILKRAPQIIKSVPSPKPQVVLTLLWGIILTLSLFPFSTFQIEFLEPNFAWPNDLENVLWNNKKNFPLREILFLSSWISPPCPKCVCINHQLLLISIYQVMFHGTLVPQKSPLKNKRERENIPGTISLENTKDFASLSLNSFFFFFSFSFLFLVDFFVTLAY